MVIKIHPNSQILLQLKWDFPKSLVAVEFVLNIIEVNGPLGLWTFWLYGLCCKGVLL